MENIVNNERIVKKKYSFKKGIVVAILAILLSTSAVYASILSDKSDTDLDGLTNEAEKKWGTDPYDSDSDGDGFLDGEEVNSGYSPVNTERKKMGKLDTDSDGLNDALEFKLGTLPNNEDTNGNGKKDGYEIAQGVNPLGVNITSTRSALVDLSTQKLKYFFNGIEIGTIPVSTGVLGRETPKGEFNIMKKLPYVNYRGADYNFPNTKWNLRFKQSYYLHGAFWHNQFGIKPMSHGCVNIAYKDAEKIYNFLQEGDKVSIVGQTPKGKVVQKIVKQ